MQKYEELVCETRETGEKEAIITEKETLLLKKCCIIAKECLNLHMI